VDFAQARGSKAIVFKALRRLGMPQRTGWLKPQDLRRAYRMRGQIMRWVRYIPCTTVS
jgi:hypothetical protein